MKQCLLHIEPLGVTLSADRGTSLYEVLKNCHLEFPCGGKGLCGNCKVRILSGQVEKTEVTGHSSNGNICPRNGVWPV